ncbi:MAG: hypothetical protein U1E65_32765 [Myxococcota bacterium]
MATWTEGYNALPDEAKVNVQRWIHLNKFIAQTLKIDELKWFEGYLGEAMAQPFDYSFMGETMPGLSGLGLEGKGEVFTRGMEPGGFVGPRVPLRAKNNMGRLSPALQDALAGLIEQGEPSSVALSPADVATLQKIFPTAKGLAKLKRPDFRSVALGRDMSAQEVTMSAASGELLRMNVMEFAAVLSRALT